MQVLTFYIGDDLYALRTSLIIEVAPMIKLKKLAIRERFVAGLLNFRGVAVPVLDLGRLLTNRDCRKLVSTRIVVIRYWISDKEYRPLGLIVERATEITGFDETEAKDYGLHSEDSPYLGKVINTERGMLQLIEPEQVLQEPLRTLLFRDRSRDTGPVPDDFLTERRNSN